VPINNKYFILGYRVASVVVIVFGLLATLGAFSGSINYYIFFAYTTQSNILVLGFFVVLVAKTAAKIARGEDVVDKSFGFYPVAAFAVTFAIFITMMIFWGILVPLKGGMSMGLMTFYNLGVHLFCPLLMIGDYLLFYKKGVMRRRDPLAITIFPYLYIGQSFALGLNHVVYFAPLHIESYYIYPFMDFDAHGRLVFLFLLALTAFFLGLGYVCYYLEKRVSKTTMASKL
jgi:hypothetical protein